MKIFDILMGRKKVRSAYTGDSSFVSRWARPPSMNTAEWLEMYSKSPRLAVVEKIATDLASLDGHLLRVNPDGSETELTRHPFLDFMAHPNPLYEMTRSAIWRLNEIHLMLVGESFFLIERDENERPVELWNVPPHWVKMTPYLGSPGYMITSPSGLTMTVPVDDMFVMKHLNPLDPFMRGLGVAESIADEIEIDEFSAQFQKRFFYNDGTPSIVFLMPDATEPQRNAFIAEWNKRHRGVEKSHKAAAITGNVDVKTFGSSDIRELGFVESRLALRDAVLEHFGVPREIMGITENSNRSTADSAQYIYAKNVLTPRIRDREEAINQQLLPLFGDNLVWRFDPVIPYDKEFDKSRALDGWNAGLLTKNEARGLMDLPDVPDGNVFKIGINDLFMEQVADPAEVSQVLGTSYGEKSGRRVNVEAMLRKEDAALRENERKFEAAIVKHFSEQRSAISKALGMTAKAGTNALTALDGLLLPDGTFDPMLWEALKEEERQKLAQAVAAGLLDWKKEAKKLTARFTPLWKQAYDDGAKISAESYGLAAISRPEFVSQARINGGKRVVGIQATTQKKISSIIAQGVENGSSQNELKKEILAAMGPGTTHARAKLIAQQETLMSLATGQFDTMKAAGAKTKTWHHRDPQKDPRDGTHGKVDHVKLEDEKDIPIDNPFSNGLMYPRDPNGRPEEVIRCHCYLTFTFEDTPETNLKPALTEPPEETIMGADGESEQTPPLTMGEYVGADGTFDLDRAKTDYKKFLQSVPEKNGMYLEQALDAVEFKETSRPDVVFGYNPVKDVFLYNTSHPSFYRYDFQIVATHELAHRIDSFFVRSWEDEAFSKAIARERNTIGKEPEKYISYCEQNDTNGFLSDILSALCEADYEFLYAHDKEYWELPNRKQQETFSNLFSLEAFENKRGLQFIEENFPDLWDAYCQIWA